MSEVWPDTITIEVTQDYIRLGQRHSATCCPVAKASEPHIPPASKANMVSVTSYGIGFFKRNWDYKTPDEYIMRYRMPYEAYKRITIYENTGTMEPFTFTAERMEQ